MARVRVDFRGVSDEGGGALQAGQYRCVIDNVEKKDSERSGKPMIVATYKVNKGPHKGETILDFMSLQKQALWKFKRWLKDVGTKVKEKEYDLDLDEYIGLQVVVQLGDPRKSLDTGNLLNNVQGVVSAGSEEEEEEEEEDEDIEPAVHAKKKKPRVEEDDSEDDEDEDEEEEERPRKKFKRVTRVE